MLARLRDVYSQMILFLFLFTLFGAYTFGIAALANVAAAVAAAVAADMVANYCAFKSVALPKSGIITGFLVGLIVPFNYLYAAAGAIIAVASKHLITRNKKHIFNPAAFGIIVSSAGLSFSTSWWVATPVLGRFVAAETATPFVHWVMTALAHVPLGLVILYGIRRAWTAASFLAAYALLGIFSSIARFGAAPAFLSLFDLTTLFFALFMLIEPVTTPSAQKPMIAFGTLVAAAAFVIRETGPGLTSFLRRSLLATLPPTCSAKSSGDISATLVIE